MIKAYQSIDFFLDVSQEDMADMEAREKEQKEQDAQKRVFEGLKFYLNREVPRESLAFAIRWAGNIPAKNERM